MHIKKLWTVYFILIFIMSSLLTISASSEGNSPPPWNKNWSYRQEIKIPISTDNPFAKFQPIDIHMEFDKTCWAKNETIHSVRVLCWDGSKWHELESQIYDLEFTDINHIARCELIFLVPDIADGKEKYFVYYDDNEKPSPKYIDHVGIEDAYYYLEPISGVSVEGDYYKITEDGYCVYGVGQKGKVVYRQLSQCIIKEKPGTKEFDAINSDQIASFSFSYSHGPEDEDEISSDQSLVSKQIFVDGNLMVEFGIVSESLGKDMRTTNIYKYYYCPTVKKRICVHVKHEVLDGGIVVGIENVDGRYGALISFRSKSARIQQMRFGEILPYLHVYGENDDVLEYPMNTNPENKQREWIISYSDDCDLGEDAWMSYDEGENGKAHAILFSSNKNIVKRGTDERDGIQVKAVEREYLDILGTEVDYATINFGRNSYEKGGTHDLSIPGNLVVEFDTEFFTTEDGSYKDVIEEGKIYRVLVEHRHKNEGDLFEGKNIHTLTVIPRLSGRFLSYPWLAMITGRAFPVIWVELYRDDTLVSSGIAIEPFLGPTIKKFPKLSSGEYVVKVYRKAGDDIKNYIGFESVKIEGDMILHVYCTWQKNIGLAALDQYGKGIEDIGLVISKEDIIVAKNITVDIGEAVLSMPFDLFDSYVLRAFYKGFIIYDEKIQMTQKDIDINLDIYDLKVEIKDKLGLYPGVDVRPFLTSSEMYQPLRITPMDLEKGRYIFRNLPDATYELQISYGGFFDRKNIDIPEIGDSTDIRFTATFDLVTELFDIRGNTIQDKNQRLDIIRNGQAIYNSIESNKIVSLPPGEYTIEVYSDGKLMGSKIVELTNDRNIKMVTTVEPLLPIVITGLVLVFIGEIIVLFLFKKISLNALLKLMAMALILIALFQPWWTLNASDSNHLAEKKTEMFIVPQTMIETITYENRLYPELATIPELFTNFLGVLLLIICVGFVLLGVSFIPNIFLKRRFPVILISASILLLVLVAGAFSFGMSKICEITLGSLQGEGALDVILPNGETTVMSASWGLGSGFYLCIVSALIAIAAGIVDFINKKKRVKKSTHKK